MENTTRALQAAIAEPWAITAEGLELVVAVAARENVISPEALEAYRAEHVPTAERLEKRGSVAIISAIGPMVRRANILSAISGATSYDVMRRDFQAALDDPQITAIVLNLDTPGGTVSGTNELAKAIFDARSRKRIVAYIGNTAASAGYWLASQGHEIVIDETASLGSIGVRAVITDTSKQDAEKGRMEFISSRAPGKRLDLATDEGRGRVQRTIDALEDVFIAAVAKGRGVKADDVVAKFGSGDTLVGSAAIAAGMADRIGTFEAVVAELAEGRSPTPQSHRRKVTMGNENMISMAEHEAAVTSARSAGVSEGRTLGATDERARISAIQGLEEANGREASARHLALNTSTTVEDAKGILAGLTPAAVAPAPTEPNRSVDAPGGLVLAGPVQPVSPEAKTKDIWGKAVTAVNASQRR